MALRASVKERRYSPAPHAVRAEVRDIPTPGRGADSAESARNARAMWTLASCRIGPFLLQVNRLQVPQMHQRVQQAAMLWLIASSSFSGSEPLNRHGNHRRSARNSSSRV